MKLLSAGLTFVNFATVCGLVFGMLGGGLGPVVAVLSCILAASLAVFAFAGTNDATPVSSSESPTRSYQSPPLWIIAAIVTPFPMRSICMLLYVDGSDLKIQSPV